jgi:hypothetical protein
MTQFKRLGFSPEFRLYFLRQKSHLLASGEVACGLVAYCVQDDGSSSDTKQILSLLLDEARMGLENDSEYAEDFLETVEMAVQAGVAAGAIQQSNLIELASLYRGVGLPVPQSFLIDPDNMEPPQGSEDFDLSENLESMAQAIEAEGGTAYDLFNNIDTMMAAAPEEIQAGLANHIATMDGAFFERCGLFMLLSGSELVQEATIAGLFKRLDASALNAETLALLPMIRGWFSKGPTQTALDELFKKARRQAILGQSHHDSVTIQEAIASITDGVGAQNIAVKLKRGSTTLLAMLLLKTGYGIKDAFLVPPENNSDANRIIKQLRAETGADDISVDTLRALLEGALADGLEHGHLPAPGFLDVIESSNLFDLRPQELDLQTLLNLADPDRKIQNASAQALGRWINDDIALDNLEPLTDSWFEDNETTREIVATTRTARSIEAKIWKFLDTRRDVWARRFLQTAVMLQESGRLREWQTMTSSAHGLMNGRALKRVPLMEDIMYTTIEAADAKMW